MHSTRRCQAITIFMLALCFIATGSVSADGPDAARAPSTPKVGGGSISGTVTDAGTGAPIVGIELRIRDSEGSWQATGYSDALGNYTSDYALPPGPYYVETWSQTAYINQVYDGIECVVDCDPTEGTPIVVGQDEHVTGIDFALVLGATISGTVTDSVTGAPLEEVYVEVSCDDWTEVATAETDASGKFTTYPGLPGGTHYVKVIADDHVFEVWDDIPCAFHCIAQYVGDPIELVTGVPVTGIDFALDPEASITGTVTDEATGTGLEGVFLTFTDESEGDLFYLYTDANGDFDSRNEVRLPEGTYYVHTSNSDGYIDEIYDDLVEEEHEITDGTPIVVTIGEDVTGIDIALAKGASISGRVTDSATGLGIDDASVYIYDGEGNRVSTAGADANGDYTTNDPLSAGTYYARSSNWAGYLDEIYDDLPCVDDCDPTTGTPIEVAEGEQVTGIDLALDKGGSISGTVTDSVSTSTLQGVAVLIYDPEGHYLFTRYSGSDGTYATTIGLVPGNYFARTANSIGYVDELWDDIACMPSCTILDGTPIVVGAGEDVTGIDFAIDPGASISGTVTDAATSDPIAGEEIEIYNSAGNWVTYADVAADGTYTSHSGLPAGTFYARTYSYSGYINEVYDNLPCLPICTPTSGTPIVLTTAENRMGIDFALDKGGSISGTVTDAGTATGISGLRVDIYDGVGTRVASGYTDGSGTYTSNSPLAGGIFYATTYNSGTYLDELYDNLPCPFDCTPADGTAITVSLGVQTANINFALDRGGLISGTVTDAETGQGIDDVVVRIYDASGAYLTYGRTSADGSYTINRSLPTGSYFVWSDCYDTETTYAEELWDDVECPEGCDVTTGTPVAVTIGLETTDIDFELLEIPQFSDGFESGSTSAWDFTTGGD
jgi:hypothetical protein